MHWDQPLAELYLPLLAPGGSVINPAEIRVLQDCGAPRDAAVEIPVRLSEIIIAKKVAGFDLLIV